MVFTCDYSGPLQDNLPRLYPTIPQEIMKCVEIGSFEGKGSIIINDRLCKNKESILYCIDPFHDEYVRGNPLMAFWDHACVGQYGRFKENTAHIPNLIEMKGYSDNMIPTLDDNSIDFCYIDGDHSPHQVYKDAVNVFRKMKNRSIILFDDYLWEGNGLITKLGVDRFLEEYKGRYELLISNWQLAIRIIK